MFLENLKNKDRGFTFIEITIVIALIAIFTSVFIISGNLKENKETKALQSSVDVFLTNCREVQTSAMNSKKYNGNIYCGWGIHYVNNSSYIIYVEAGDGSACTGDPGWRNYQAGTDVIVKEVELINSNLVQFSGVFDDIYFEPPNPDVYGGGTKLQITAGNLEDLTIRLISDASKFKQVYFNGAGNIWLE